MIYLFTSYHCKFFLHCKCHVNILSGYMKRKKWRQKFNDLRNDLLLFVGFVYSGHNVLLTGFKFLLVIYTTKIFTPVLRRVKQSTGFSINHKIGSCMLQLIMVSLLIQTINYNTVKYRNCHESICGSSQSQWLLIALFNMFTNSTKIQSSLYDFQKWNLFQKVKLKFYIYRPLCLMLLFRYSNDETEY
jgi:hypothetical protein